MTIYDADYTQYTDAGVGDSAAGNQAVEPFHQEAPEVPVDQIVDSDKMVDNTSEKEFNFKALRESIAQEKAEREAERQRYQYELENMRSQINSRAEPQKGALDDMSEGDLMTVEKYRKAQAEQQQRYEAELTTLRYENLENRARLQHSDYDEVMDKYSIPFLRNNEDFARAFQVAKDPAHFAYTLGKMQMTPEPTQRAPEPQISRDAERMIQNAKKPGTLSSARGGEPTISKADLYSQMTQAQFDALVAKNLEEV